MAFDEAQAEQICERIANGESLRQVAEAMAIGSPSNIIAETQKNAHFAAQYARAMDLRVDVMADEIIDIAEDGRNDWEERENKDGSTYTALNREAIERSRLRIDARKWTVSKLKPKKYGDRIQSDVDLSVTVTVVNAQ